MSEGEKCEHFSCSTAFTYHPIGCYAAVDNTELLINNFDANSKQISTSLDSSNAVYFDCYRFSDGYQVVMDLYEKDCEYSMFYGRMYSNFFSKCKLDQDGLYHKSYCIDNFPKFNTPVTN